MLHSLYIKNLAIINEIRVVFNNGLNIITGETGTGKSLIIKAIQLLLGGRFTREIIRTGTDQMVIEGIFRKNNLDTTIRRLYNLNGQSKSYLNNEPIIQRDLMKATRELVDLHGQHEHQNLLDYNTHIQYLDAFGKYDQDLNAFRKLFNELEVCQNKLNNLLKEQVILEEKQELRNFQLKELELYPVTEKYEENIIKKYQMLSNAEKIKDSLSSAINVIDTDQYSILTNLNELNKKLDEIVDYSDNLSEILNRISSIIIDIEDIYKVLLDIDRSVYVDKTELHEMNEKLSHIELLKRKYGGTIASVIKYLDVIQRADKTTNNNYKKIQSLNGKIIILRDKLNKKAEIISEKRYKTALQLETKISDNLKNLNIPNIDFKIKLSTDIQNMNEIGIDICEFFIATNVGEIPKSLSQIASGGEISRIMLAIKMALQTNDIVSTLIFDEIDSGISGSVAEQVGNTIEDLSNSHQILCITHLSQIAGKGEHHYKVQKSRIKNRNLTEIKKLSVAERVCEVASLISGKEITEASRRQAKTLLTHG